MYFLHSKHLHMTVLVASPQNVRSCTRILPITEDRCSKLPCVTTTTLLSSLRSFLSCIFFPVCASYLARICVIFNCPPTIVLALPMQLFNSKQSALLFFCTVFLHLFFSLPRLGLLRSLLRVCTKSHSVCVPFFLSFFFVLERSRKEGGVWL
jgi:hypothetical protein